ncbi:hypothetical protein LTR04_001194 [Oleoguttula sp. CCFEE 6159]|nr:hypothetical protein LTR04_001194 [Oleoguttula sp. CCFEE 6159]
MDYKSEDRIEQWITNTPTDRYEVQDQVMNVCRIIHRSDILVMICCVCRETSLMVHQSSFEILATNIGRGTTGNGMGAMVVTTYCSRHETFESTYKHPDMQPYMDMDIFRHSYRIEALDQIMSSVTCVPSTSNKNHIMLGHMKQFRNALGDEWQIMDMDVCEDSNEISARIRT